MTQVVPYVEQPDEPQRVSKVRQHLERQTLPSPARMKQSAHWYATDGAKGLGALLLKSPVLAVTEIPTIFSGLFRILTGWSSWCAAADLASRLTDAESKTEKGALKLESARSGRRKLSLIVFLTLAGAGVYAYLAFPLALVLAGILLVVACDAVGRSGTVTETKLPPPMRTVLKEGVPLSQITAALIETFEREGLDVGIDRPMRYDAGRKDYRLMVSCRDAITSDHLRALERGIGAADHAIRSLATDVSTVRELVIRDGDPLNDVVPAPWLESGSVSISDRLEVGVSMTDTPFSLHFADQHFKVIGSTGSGKALALDTPMLTANRGWTTHGELIAGDQVFDEAGQPCNVVHVSERWVNRPCYRMAFSDGSSIVADANHEWAVNIKHRGGGTMSTKGLAQDYVSTARDGSLVRRYSVDVCGPLAYPEADLPIRPYTLGAWLGDGSSDSGQITAGSQDVDQIRAELEREGERLSVTSTRPGIYMIQVNRPDPDRCVRGHVHTLGKIGCPECGKFWDYWRYHHSSPPPEAALPPRINQALTGRLRGAGLLGNKRIPDAYFNASTQQRLALLQGLMDTDGSALKSHQCEFQISDKGLCEDVLALVLGLGIKATMRERRAKISGVDKGPCWRITFTTSIPVFRLERKLHRLPTEVKAAGNRSIVLVEPVENQVTSCITVDSPSHLYLAGRNLIPTHNSAWFLRNCIDRVSACRNAAILGIDLHGMELDLWRGVVQRKGRTPDEAKALLTEVLKEISRRTAVLRRYAEDDDPSNDHLTEWCDELAEREGPAWVIFVDEYHKVAEHPELLAMCETVVREGRKTWVTMKALSQKYGNSDFGSKVMTTQANTTIAFPCDADDAVRIFGKTKRDAGWDPSILTPGTKDGDRHIRMDAGKGFVESPNHTTPDIYGCFAPLSAGEVKARARRRLADGIPPMYVDGRADDVIEAAEVPAALTLLEKVFAEYDTDRIPSAMVLEFATEQGERWTDMSLADALRPHGVETHKARTELAEGRSVMCYYRSELQAALGTLCV